jgi:hypothetical protein
MAELLASAGTVASFFFSFLPMEKLSLTLPTSRKQQFRESSFQKKSHYIPLERVKHEHIWSWQKRAPGSSSSISSTKGKEMRKQWKLAQLPTVKR